MNATASDAGLAAAIDGLIHHALERAGHRLWSRQPRPQRPPRKDLLDLSTYHVGLNVTPGQIDEYRLLAAAWRRAPVIAIRYGVPADTLTTHLDGYCRRLITTRRAHRWENIPDLVHHIRRTTTTAPVAHA